MTSDEGSGVVSPTAHHTGETLGRVLRMAQGSESLRKRGLSGVGGLVARLAPALSGRRWRRDPVGTVDGR